MKYVIETDDLKTLLDGLNNAIVCLGQVGSCLELGVDSSIPTSINDMLEKRCGDDDTAKAELISKRFNAVKDLYKQLLKEETYENTG